MKSWPKGYVGNDGHWTSKTRRTCVAPDWPGRTMSWTKGPISDDVLLEYNHTLNVTGCREGEKSTLQERVAGGGGLPYSL